MRIAHLHVQDRKNKGDVAIVQSVQQLLNQRLPNLTIDDYPAEILKSGSSSMLRALNRADGVIIGGGGLYYRWFTPYDQRFLSAIISPILTYGVGYIRELGAPPLSRQAAAGIALLNRRARLCSVRDYATKQLLVRNGVPPHKIKLVGDPCIFLNERPPRAFPLNPSRMKIGINLNYSGWLGFGRYQSVILESYRQLATHLRQRFKAEIFYLQHHPDEARIQAKLKLPNLRLVDRPPVEQKYIYGKLNLVVGMMLHSAVMAFGAGTPEINVAYDQRNFSFARFIGQPKLVLDVRTLTPKILIRRAEEVLRHEQAYRRQFSLRKQRIWKTQDQFLTAITHALRNP